jgi:predicted membrane-bound spermidine synthase/Flp pilus assembly protein TadD
MLLYPIFLVSGAAGLIYQVVWVRVFGNVFGNTVYSASLVIAVFMLGLGAGGYAAGGWSDRRYARRPESLLRAYAVCELAIAAVALLISRVLPHLGGVSAATSAYSRDASGWYALTVTSYLARGIVLVALLAPVTLLMGATLTLLIRHLVRRDADVSGWRIAVLYGVNTLGAAIGCLLTDVVLVPSIGLARTQELAVLLNVAAAAGAWALARWSWVPGPGSRVLRPGSLGRSPRKKDHGPRTMDRGPRTIFVALALALSGFAAMGMEIVWFRHFTILLGGFRAVFSVLLTIILLGIGVGSLASTIVYRRGARPAEWLMIVQALFVATTLAGLAVTDSRAIDAAAAAAPYSGSVWFNAKPMLIELALPALLMGFGFPLANAIIQREERDVGTRAGLLYLANTAGAVCGSVTAGFVLLPYLGIQHATTTLTVLSALAIVPLLLSSRERRLAAPVSALGFAGCAVTAWLLLPSGYVITRALPVLLPGDRLLAMDEGLTEVVTVIDRPREGRTLFTNGHPMSSTAKFSQRYMRALAHIPLLSMERPGSVLVIGFGVGNTAHAATLYPTVHRVDVADLSRGVLSHASYFSAFNHDVLRDPQVTVYVNDGRHHLQMQPPGTYDLITLEPPPIAYAGVAALYSREFYALARTRLKPQGYMSQWLPSYQVPGATTLAMIRAFIDVFPNSVLLSGAQADLLLVGTSGPRIEIDPARVAAALASAPQVQSDLSRVDLGTVTEIVGTFLGSPKRLSDATRGVDAVTDDRPIQEYASTLLPAEREAVPETVVNLADVSAWCPRCFAGGRPVGAAEGLDTYLRLADRAYLATPAEEAQARALAEQQGRVIEGSSYLGAIVPETADVHDIIGISRAERGRLDEAVAEFRHALQLDPASASTHWHLGTALAESGAPVEAIEHLRQSVELDPSNAGARTDLARLLIDTRQFAAAADQARAAVRLAPDSAVAHGRLGVALAGLGHIDEAIDHFKRAVALDPDSPEAQRNLEIARHYRTSGRAK